ncbi:MAG: DPP IV N-terminal domain-containing protein [Proteobacteria bacterium]|nr:DPP IV N-terminal domain-containing protein [Pseudomonadota bacterium]
MSCRWAAAVLMLGCVSATSAQGTLADYQRAAVFQNARSLVSGTSLTPHWIGASDEFWFESTVHGTKAFVRVDPATNTMRSTFDQAPMAAGAREGEVLSPDGRWAVFIREHNLWVRDTRSDAQTALTSDGAQDFDYGSDAGFSASVVSDRLLAAPLAPEVYFSPDSQQFLSYRIDARGVRDLALVETVPGASPRLHTYHAPLAGDETVATAQMILFDLAKRTQLPLQYHPIKRIRSSELPVCWNRTSTMVCFLEEERGFKTVRLLAADARTGEVRTLVEEHSATYVKRDSLARLVGDGHDLVWTSERDGWNHLYRIDTRTGAVLNQITQGDWVVRDIHFVDDKRGYIYFTAGGKEPGRDPYYRHLYRVKLNGARLERLTPEDADHEIEFSPTGRYFTDTYSRIDAAPVSVLRAADGRLIRVLQRADIGPLLATGWKAPEPFKVKARDGRTDLYGAIFRPSNFDPARRYPVVDAIYPGPQHIRTPKSFDVKGWENDQALAELGFVVVTIDGLGTPERSRAFHTVSYGKLGDAGGLEDHIAGLRQLAARYPYLDLSRVGIYGHSGGGYASARALLKFPEFYKVAVSSAGDHDLRSYWVEWGERFQGYPVDESFESQANAPLAANLQGKLLLAYGDLDDNVHPSNTLQLVDALIAANKNFDLLVLPNRDHQLINLGKGPEAQRRMDPYFLRRRWDYFVKYLLGVEPPEFKLAW